MPGRMSAIVEVAPQLIASATLRVETPGVGLTEITEHAVSFIDQITAADGVLLIYLRHTSASLTIQENADPDVQSDLIAALDRLAPESAPWIHDVEGPDDMPAHVKAMLNGVSLHVPVVGVQAGARHLAGYLSCRAPPQAAQPRNHSAIHRQPEYENAPQRGAFRREWPAANVSPPAVSDLSFLDRNTRSGRDIHALGVAQEDQADDERHRRRR